MKSRAFRESVAIAMESTSWQEALNMDSSTRVAFLKVRSELFEEAKKNNK